jgi:hypothetical protein
MEIEKKYLVSKDLLLSQTYEYIEIQHIEQYYLNDVNDNWLKNILK